MTPSIYLLKWVGVLLILTLNVWHERYLSRESISVDLTLEERLHRFNWSSGVLGAPEIVIGQTSNEINGVSSDIDSRLWMSLRFIF